MRTSHLVAILLIAYSSITHAQTTTYTYSGSSYSSYQEVGTDGEQYTIVAPTSPSPCPIALSITIPPIPPNSNFSSSNINASQFTVSDCANTITNSNATSATFVLNTDANGKINNWGFYITGNANNSVVYQPGVPYGGFSFSATEVVFFSESEEASDAVEYEETLDGDAIFDSYFDSSPGSWGGGKPSHCKVSIPNPETQSQLPWGPMTYDSSNLGLPPVFTISNKGCALTDISMALEADSLSEDPGYLNALFNSFGGYQPQAKPSGQRTANVIWAKDVLLAEATHSVSLAWNPLGDVVGPSATATSLLNTELCGDQPAPATQVPTPVIVGVTLDSNNVPGHYVLVNGQASNGDYTILDPGHGKEMLSDYGNFTVKGAIQDPSDLSFLSVSAGDSVELMLTDPSGDITGLDLSTTSKYQAIPNSVYSDERLDTINDNGSTTVDPYLFHQLTVMQPAAGAYTLNIQGRYTGTFSLTIDSASSAGVVQPPLTLFGGVESSSSQTYSIPIEATGVTVAGAPPSGTECNGVYNGTFKGDLFVSNGQSCIFLGGTIEGRVRVAGGALILSNTSLSAESGWQEEDSERRKDNDGFSARPSIWVTGGNLSLNNAVINGSVLIIRGGSISVGPSTTINGSLIAESIPTGSGIDVICGATVHGDVLFRNNGVTIEIGDRGSCPGNVIDRDLQVRDNSGTTLIYNDTVGGDLRDDNNIGATEIFNNSVKYGLGCQNDLTITGGENKAERKEGQCATF